MGNFFKELDEITKPLFDFFKDSEKNEYESFENQILITTPLEEAIKDFMKGGVSTVEIHPAQNPTINPNETQTKPNDLHITPKLTINQIALKYVYSGTQITREKGNEIAKEYGHNSGEKLFQRFTFYSSRANRTGKPIPCTPKKINNKIKLIESIIELLPTDKQGLAKDEVLILKNTHETEY